MIISAEQMSKSVHRAENSIRTIDSTHDEADLCSIGGAGEMCVDLLRLLLI